MFQTPGADSGCSAISLAAKQGLNRKKSMSSQAESISAWNAVLLWPSRVAALRIGRYLVLSKSAALRNTAARRSQGSVDHDFQELAAACTACSTCSAPA